MHEFSKNGKLLPEVEDALYELSNVGVGQATNALGSMTGRRITIGTPQVFSNGVDIAEFTGMHPSTIVMGILMQMTESLGGAIMILISKDFMADLVCRLTGTRYDDTALVENEDSLSVIQEVANIMASGYMNAIGAYTGLRVYMTPVMVGVDMVSALIAYPITQMSLSGSQVISVDTSFCMPDSDDPKDRCNGRMIMIPDETSLRVIVNALGL